MRRSATVTSSLPLAAIASRSSSKEGKPPVPSSRRECRVRPAIVNGSLGGAAPLWALGEWTLMLRSSSLHRRENLHARILGQDERLPLPPRYDLAVDGHGDAASLRRHAEAAERRGDRLAGAHVRGLSVEPDHPGATGGG